MPKRLVATNIGMETTPGDLTTLNAHYQANGEQIAINAGAWSFMIDFTLISLNVNNEVPLVTATYNRSTGFFILANGTLVFRNNGVNTNIALQHVSLTPNLLIRKTIRISGHGSNKPAGWRVTVNGIDIGIMPNSATGDFSGLRCYLGHFDGYGCPSYLHAFEILDADPATDIYVYWDGTGIGAIQNELWSARTAKPYVFAVVGGSYGPNNDMNCFMLVEEYPQSGSYAYVANDVMDLATTNSSIDISPLFQINWDTTSFNFEVDFIQTGVVYFFRANGGLEYFSFENDGSVRFISWTNSSMGFTVEPIDSYPRTISPSYRPVRYNFAWNHVTKTITSGFNGKTASKVLNTTNYSSWGGVIPNMVDATITSQDELAIGLNSGRLYRFKINVTGYQPLEVDFTNLRPPLTSELRQFVNGSSTWYYYDFKTPTGYTVSLLNPLTKLQYFSEENPIDYVGPLQPLDILVGPSLLATLPFSTIEAWFRINGLTDASLTHSLETTAGFVKNTSLSRYEFTYPGSAITPITVRVRAGITGFDNEYSISPTFQVRYRASDLNFEPTFFDSSAFDTTVIVPTHTRYDSFQYTAFQWQFFDMTYIEGPQTKLRKLKYYTGTQWTGVPIKMWTGTAWVEVALKACLVANSFTKISG